jgi:hypothetical protein
MCFVFYVGDSLKVGSIFYLNAHLREESSGSAS